jgi:N-acyl-phosphatidylethanolamine-hydrolysing phospholipase D
MVVERLTSPRAPDPPRSVFARAQPSFAVPRAGPDRLAVTWVGHSTFLLQVGGLNVLTDPVWGERASPVPFAGPRRWTPPGVDFDALPPIDVVLQSHDHYDHLDAPTVRRLARRHRGAVWLAPLGLRRWLERRGVGSVLELDWWEEVRVGESAARATCVPAQHFSGRWIAGRNATLWCGWALRTGRHAVLFAGDTGHHPEFARIAERCGPFDLALLPVGAYAPRWFMRAVHCDPSDAVAAYTELTRGSAGRRCLLAAMHWGTFKLSDEPIEEPPRRLRAEWQAAGLDGEALWTPTHGETRELTAET